MSHSPSNEASDLKDKIKVEVLRYRSIRQTDSGCTVVPFTPEERAKLAASGLPRIARSEAFHLNITNASNRPVMIYIFSVDANGAISLLYPPRNARESVFPNTILSTNLGNACLIYAFDADAPVGFETIKVIASQNPIEADLLTQSGIKGNERSGGSPLERMLVQAGGNTRGPKPFNGSVADWAAINFDYVVVP